MRKILIVDDEILVRVGLRALLDWGASGYEIVGEAASGDEALALLDSLAPDIVLTDLVMGPGDGFSLVRALRARSSATGIVILSCRNDFDAVREALRLGADDYVFKLTMRGDEIIEVLDRVSAKHGSRLEGQGKPPIESRSPPQLPLISRWAAGSVPEAERNDLLASAEAEGLEEGFFTAYRAAVFSLAALPQGEANADPEPTLFLQAIKELKRRDLPRFEVLDFGGGKVLVLLKGSYRDAPRELAAGIDEYARRYFGRPAIGGASEPASGMERLPHAASQAEEARAWSFFAGPGFHESPELPPLAFLDEPGILKVGQALKAALRSLGRAALEESISALFASFRAARGSKPERIKTLVWDLLAPLREIAAAARVDLEAGVFPEGPTAHLAMFTAPDLPALEALVRLYVSRSADLISRETASRCRPEIRRVLDRVREDLARSLSVDEAAAIATMSPSHFEHVFKRETGESYLRFVTKARMERASELLARGDLRIYEVASALGYENANYFSTLYKQFTGKTPQEARSETRS